MTSLNFSPFGSCSGKIIIHCNINSCWLEDSKFNIIEIGEEVKNICSGAFENIKGTIIIKCDIADAEKSSKGWFYGSKAPEVILEETVKKVGQYAFFGVASMEKLTIGSNVNSIGYGAFYNCTGLTSIYCNAINPPVCQNMVFSQAIKQECTLYVPEGSLDAYKAANEWKDFLNIQESPIVSSLESITTMNNLKVSLYDLQGTQVVTPRHTGLYLRDGKKIILK